MCVCYRQEARLADYYCYAPIHSSADPTATDDL